MLTYVWWLGHRRSYVHYEVLSKSLTFLGFRFTLQQVMQTRLKKEVVKWPSSTWSEARGTTKRISYSWAHVRISCQKLSGYQWLKMGGFPSKKQRSRATIRGNHGICSTIDCLLTAVNPHSKWQIESCIISSCKWHQN